jgi:pimeloyl-ACP methyl ester carboxylesterase
MAATAAGARARVATRDGHTLHAEAHGEGLPLVLSCALATTRENWRPQVAPLVAAGVRVVLWDYRGHGLSDAPEDPGAYTLENVLDDLGRVLDWAVGDAPVVAGGLSFGGLLSLHLALARPERVRGLVLADSGPGFKKPEAQARWEAMVERTASFVERRGMHAFATGKAASTLSGLLPDAAIARAASDAIAAQTPHGIASFARRVAGPASPVLDQLAGIEAPALVIVGEKDDLYLRAADVLEARLPRAERVTLAGAGHIANLDAPEAFDAALIGFLRGLGAYSGREPRAQSARRRLRAK